MHLCILSVLFVEWIYVTPKGLFLEFTVIIGWQQYMQNKDNWGGLFIFFYLQYSGTKASVPDSECHPYFSPYTQIGNDRETCSQKTRDEALSSDGQPHCLRRTLGLFIWSSVYFLFSWDTAAARHPVNAAATQLLYLIIISI